MSDETVKKYVEHLIHKWYIFKDSVELEPGNCVDETELIINDLVVPSKITDKTMTDLTRDILERFRCYEIIDDTFQNRLTETKSVDVYQNYKSYKQNERSKREHAAAESDCCGIVGSLKQDCTLDTSDTMYQFSLDDITTKDLVSAFGEPVKTGTGEDKHRYEYKFRFGEHTFSLYDWKNERNEFFDYVDIYWHVAANTRSKSIISAFKQSLIQS